MPTKHFVSSLQNQKDWIYVRLLLMLNFSILMDGSTDVSNIDEEMLWCDTDGNDEKVHSRLFDCLQKSL